MPNDAHHDELIEAMRAFGQGQKTLSCPRCGHTPLTVDDRSTPPYAHWYQVDCTGCGMDELVHIPLGVAISSG